MTAMLQLESSLTDRYQTTVPSAVRQALRLRKRDKILFSVERDGVVVLTRASAKEQADPVLGRFLRFLARDMEEHPERVKALSGPWLARAKSLVKGVKVDLGKPLAPSDDK
ncbi:MAG: type II toxin-antitoxin system PrlF family antitoxin [bacterium]